MNFKKILRLVALTIFIGLACIVPFPLNLFRKDDQKKTEIELVEKHQDIDENENENYKF